MKRIYNSDVRLQTDGMNLPEAFTFNFYTIDQNINITKDESDVDENGYINLDWSMLQLLGEGALSYVLTKHIPDESYPDGYYDTTVTRVTNYYIVTTVQPIPPSESATTLEVIINLIEDFEDDMLDLVAAEASARTEADENIIEDVANLNDRVTVLETTDFTGYTYNKAQIDAKDAATLEQSTLLVNNAQRALEQQIRQSVDDMATQTWVGQQGYLTQHQDLSGYLTRSDYNIDQRHMASKDWTQTYLEDEGYATKDYVQAAIEGGVDLSNYYTKDQTYNKDEVDAKIAEITTDTFPTRDEMAQAIATASGNTITWVENQHYLTEHQDLSDYALKTDVTSAVTTATDDMATQTWVQNQGYLTEHQSLADYYTSAQTNNAIATASGNTITWVVNQNYLTEHQDLSGYALKTDVTSAVTSATDDMATKTWVGQQGYLTEHQSLADYYTKSETYNKTEVDDAIANVDVSEQLVNYATTAVTADLQVQINGKQAAGNYVEESTLNDYYTSAETDNLIAGYIDGAVYVSSAKTINFYHGSTIVAQVDATDFIKDGMVTNVAIDNGNLVITFNTDAGQEPISIPLTDIFNPANYYTSAETANAIATASGNTIDWVKEQNYLTQHQSLADYALKTDVTSAVTNATNDMATQTWVGQQGYLTEHQSLADYYTSAQTDTNIATVSGMVIQWVINQNYLTEHQDLTDYALKTDVTSAITSATDDMATKTWVGQQGYLTQHQSLADYYTKSETNNAIATASANTLTAVENKGYLTTEAEPAFNASAAKNITSSDITNWNGKSDFSGSYNDLTDKPTIPDVSDYYTSAQTDQKIATASGNTITAIEGKHYATTATTADLQQQVNGKQATLVSGTNIKTVNNTSLLGEGDITIQGGNDVIELTQAEYNALVEIDEDALYIITDAQNFDPSNYYTSAATDVILDDYATKTWVGTQGYSTFSGSYNDLTDKPTIPTVPTNVSAFNNDAHYVTTADTVNSALTANSATTATIANSVPSGVTGYAGAMVIRQMTQTDYDNLPTKDNNTVYIIVN